MDVPFISGFFTNTRGQQYGPLVRKKKLKKATGSGIVKPDPMAKAPRGPRGKQVIRKRTGFPKRQPVKRTSAKRKRLGPRGKFKKPKKVRKIATKYHNHRYEQEGTCNAGQPFMYVGLNDCHKREAIWDGMADALLRPILARECKFFPLQDTDKIGNINDNSKRLIVFDFKRVKGIAGAENLALGLASDGDLSTSRIDLDDTTYEAMRAQMSTMLQYRADGTISSAPNGDSVASYPFSYHTSTSVSTTAGTIASTVVSTFEHVGETMIDLMFIQKTMFVNRTLAEGGGAPGEFTDRLGTNPLKGKLYEFGHSQPRIADHVDMSTALKTSIQSDPAAGIAKYTSTDAADSHLAHPLAAKFWLKNCLRESSISLAPGASKTHSTTKSIKGKLSSLIERFYFSGYDKGTFGSSSLFMFDMVHKSDQTPTTTYKRLCIVKSAGKLKQPKIYIPDFEATTANL